MQALALQNRGERFVSREATGKTGNQVADFFERS